MFKRLFPLILSSLAMVAPAVSAQTVPPTDSDTVNFELYPATKLLPCLSIGDGSTPAVNITVRRGKLNDALLITLKNIKPGLKFDLFTVQNSNQQADGTAVPNFSNFGLAWYQSDLEAKEYTSTAAIKTILLDQIFGFDPAVNLPPTQTLHMGFWFNSPEDAAACGFTGTTPFNGDHKAGPLAFISRPNPQTGLGPLCTQVDDSTVPPTCKP